MSKDTKVNSSSLECLFDVFIATVFKLKGAFFFSFKTPPTLRDKFLMRLLIFSCAINAAKTRKRKSYPGRRRGWNERVLAKRGWIFARGG